jgi:hyperosmotically inducible periplasmic protein
MRKFKSIILAIAAVFAITTSAAVAAPGVKTVDQGIGQQQIMKKIRKELVTLPYYGVFDNLAYKVEGSTVTLYGQVVRPSTRKDAERRVAKIEGVERVVNQIEVLPLSSFDDSIRVRAYRTLFRTGSLYRYAMGANPSIHIVVNRGHLTLEGVVANEGDKRLANIVANGIPGVFSVTNNLRTERENRAY